MFVAKHEDCEGVGRAFREVLGWVGGATEESGDGEREARGPGDISASTGASESESGFAGCAATMVVLGQGGFVQGDMLVEVEVDAVVLG
jgi:hypothetical protein